MPFWSLWPQFLSDLANFLHGQYKCQSFLIHACSDSWWPYVDQVTICRPSGLTGHLKLTWNMKINTSMQSWDLTALIHLTNCKYEKCHMGYQSTELDSFYWYKGPFKYRRIIFWLLPDPPLPLVIKRDHLATPHPPPQMIARYLNEIRESKEPCKALFLPNCIPIMTNK